MRIAITGIGIISALGSGKEVNRARLLTGESGITMPHILATEHREWPVGEVTLSTEELTALADGGQMPEGLSRTILLGHLAANEALTDAGLTAEEVQGLKMVNGTTVGGMDRTEQVFGRWYRDGFDPTRDMPVYLQHPAHATTRYISDLCGMKNDPLTLSTACSSSMNAIIHGVQMLQMGNAERVLTGGTEALTLFHLNGFASLGILSENVCRPFAPDRDGINLGEGAAYLLLETESSALKRGAHVYGYIAGFANRCDAYHLTASSPDGDGAYLAMKHALRMAGLQPDHIEYINAHGTGTPNNDASESHAIERLFGSPFVSPRWPEPRSTKSLTGHTTSASGAIEAVFSLMLMRERGYKYVMTNAFGFGGNDSSLILSAVPTELPMAREHLQVRLEPIVRVDEDVDTTAYLSPMVSRRLSPQMKRLYVAARRALEQAGLEKPDAVIVSTVWGRMQPTVALLKTLVLNGESEFSPSLFMQSTHNAPASTLAILLGCHGYNATFATHHHSYEQAKTNAMMPLFTDDAKNVLYCTYDEETTDWPQLLDNEDNQLSNITTAQILSCN